MRRERGLVLINALVVVLMIAAIAAALLSRSEAARLRAATARDAAAIEAQLDAAQQAAILLAAPDPADEGLVHPGQQWSTEPHVYRIDDGQVRVALTDLQGRMNVNWLSAPPDAFVDEAFRRLFAEIDLPLPLLDAIRDYLDPEGPRTLPAYLRRPAPLQPRGGAVRVMEELRDVTGMNEQRFAVLESYVAALPADTAVNLNTAPLPVLRAMLHPFPAEVQAEFVRPRRDDPIEHMRELREMTVALLETEDLSGLPLDRMVVGSRWFRADLVAERGGRIAARRVIIERPALGNAPPRAAYRWALRD